MSACTECATLHHCHGTLVRHEDGTTECSQPRCERETAAHDLIVTCLDEDLRCCADQ